MCPVAKKELVRDHYDQLANNYDQWKQKNSYYYNNIKRFVNRLVRPGSRVLEVGCATGDVLAATEPSYGVGLDLSGEMIKIAQRKYPQHHFLHTSIEDYNSDQKFDYILLVDLLDDVYDLEDVFKAVYRHCHPTTKIIITKVNPYWEPLLSLLEKLGIKARIPQCPHNFIEIRNLSNLLQLLDFSITSWGFLLLLPIRIPLISYLANTIGIRLWGINRLSSVQYLILHPEVPNTTDLGLGCSVIIPCYNEQGGIQEAIKRIPQFGKMTEIIVVNDGSKDQTANRVKELLPDYPNLRLIDYSPNHGKGYAIKQGFEAATQDVLMILDADMAVPPEELPRFFEPLNKGLCQFVNGTRLIYPMEDQAMRFANHIGNQVFGLIMRFITGQYITDTLCGTKALYKLDFKYNQMGVDKWGDFDLLFGAAKLGNKIMEVPVHYKSRKFDQSKMKAFQHGMHLLKACLRGFRELVMIRPD